MSGEHRRFLLPVIVLAVGVYVMITSSGQGALRPVSLKPVQWAGIAVMAAGLVSALVIRKKPLWRLAGVIVCGIGAILVICL